MYMHMHTGITGVSIPWAPWGEWSRYLHRSHFRGRRKFSRGKK